MSDQNNQWLKHGKDPETQNQSSGTKRVAVPVTPQLDQLIELFRKTYPVRRFSKTAVMKTFLEAGAKTWYNQTQQQVQEPTQEPTPSE